jgi:hypothetical protein
MLCRAPRENPPAPGRCRLLRNSCGKPLQSALNNEPFNGVRRVGEMPRLRNLRQSVHRDILGRSFDGPYRVARSTVEDGKIFCETGASARPNYDWTGPVTRPAEFSKRADFTLHGRGSRTRQGKSWKTPKPALPATYSTCSAVC